MVKTSALLCFSRQKKEQRAGGKKENGCKRNAGDEKSCRKIFLDGSNCSKGWWIGNATVNMRIIGGNNCDMNGSGGGKRNFFIAN